ncbi:MAG: hypothetical protein WD534_16265 [Phycisphaeraceae bacterium]
MKHNHDHHHARHDAIDPDLERLLDEALASPRPEGDLAGRIAGMTESRLPRGRRADVLGRLGLGSAWRAAAAVAIVGLLGWVAVVVLTPDADTPGGPGPSEWTTLPPQQVVLSEQEERELLAAFAAAEGLDFEAFWLDQRLALHPDAAVAAESGDDELWTTGSHDPVDALLDTFEAEWLGDASQVF